METYILLMNLTEQGVKTIKEAPQRIDMMDKSIKAAGGKLVAFYATLGQYDYVAIAEGPSDEVAFTQLLMLGMMGTVRTETLKAFPRDKFADLLKKLP